MHDSVNSNNSRFKRITACATGILMLALVLFSAFYIAVETDHNCSGENCLVCVYIQQCENILRQVGHSTAQVSIASPVIFLLLLALCSLYSFPQETPVSKKVRLNN